MEQLSSPTTTQELFTQYVTQWRKHLEAVGYSSNPKDSTNCQAFQDLVHLGKETSSRLTIIALIEKEYRAYAMASDRYREECEVDLVRMHSESLLPKPSSRVWNYLLAEIDASFHDIIIPKTPNQRSRNIRDAVLNHFEALGISNGESHSKQNIEKIKGDRKSHP